MTNKGKQLEQLINERKKIDALINQLRCANSEFTATAEFVDDDFEDDVFDDTDDEEDYYDEEEESENLFEFNSINISDNNKE